MPAAQVAAAVAAAWALGVHSETPVVLSDGANTVVHLTPTPVVAKVAALTLRVREPAAWLARELDLARHLHVAGVPVVRPSPEVPAEVHRADGLPMTFWEHLPHEAVAVPTTGEMADLFRALHKALASYDRPLPALAPLGDIGRYLDGPGAAHPQHARLAEALARLAPRARALGPVRPLHGDPHPGNLLRSPAGWIWCDLEDACAGPASWDLAALAATRRLDGRAAVRAAAPDADPDELAVMVELRRLHLTCWYALFAEADPRHAAHAEALARTWR